jgi:hypothetical protein
MIRLVVILGLAACGSSAPRDSGPKAPDARPSIEPTFTFLAGDGAVAVGTPIYANVGWDSNCTYGTRSCREMPQVVEARCDAGACSGRGEHGAAFDVIPTKAGSLRGTVTVRATDGAYRKTFPFGINAVIPDGATAKCVRNLDGTVITLELTHGGKRVPSTAPPLTTSGEICEYHPRITHGWPEPPVHLHGYTCSADTLELRIETPNFKLKVACP